MLSPLAQGVERHGNSRNARFLLADGSRPRFRPPPELSGFRDCNLDREAAALLQPSG